MRKHIKITVALNCPSCGIKLTRVVFNHSVLEIVRSLDGAIRNSGDTVDMECLNCGTPIRLKVPELANARSKLA